MINCYLRAAVKLTAIRHSLSMWHRALSCETFLNFLISHANTSTSSSSFFATFYNLICAVFLCVYNHRICKYSIDNAQVLNPLDAQCDQPRQDAICVNQLKDASKRTIQDPALLQEKPDVKIFLPFRFYLYRPEELFQPNTYNRFLGEFYTVIPRRRN